MQTAGLETKRILPDSPPLFVYALTVLVSSLLVFWIQPLAVRGLLPVMGGAPVVWNTGMLFFQGTLLLGYLLAHLLDRRVSVGGQIIVLASLWLLALISAWTGGLAHLMEGTPPDSGVVLPVLWVLGALALTYGLACLSVSMLSPLVSAWLSRSEDTADPYVLYAVSNAGSIGVLLLYPFVMEPLFGVRVQVMAWQIAFAVLLTVLLQLASNVPGKRSESPSAASSPSGMSRRTAIRVILLSLLPGALLHSVTLSLSTDVASTPFLWVAPSGPVPGDVRPGLWKEAGVRALARRSLSRTATGRPDPVCSAARLYRHGSLVGRLPPPAVRPGRPVVPRPPLGAPASWRGPDPLLRADCLGRPSGRRPLGAGLPARLCRGLGVPAALCPGRPVPAEESERQKVQAGLLPGGLPAWA